MTALQKQKVTLPVNIEPILLVMANTTNKTASVENLAVNVGSVETKKVLPLKISMKSVHHKVDPHSLYHLFPVIRSC